MTTHRFKVGDLVRLRAVATTLPDEGFIDIIKVERPQGLYEVVRLLPELANGEPQYRIWHPDGQEFVTRESQIEGVPHPQPRG